MNRCNNHSKNVRFAIAYYVISHAVYDLLLFWKMLNGRVNAFFSFLIYFKEKLLLLLLLFPLRVMGTFSGEATPSKLL